MISGTIAISPVPGDSMFAGPGTVIAVTTNRDAGHIVGDPIALKLHLMIVPTP